MRGRMLNKIECSYSGCRPNLRERRDELSGRGRNGGRKGSREGCPAPAEGDAIRVLNANPVPHRRFRVPG